MPSGSVDEIQTPQKSDLENLQGDWIRVGQDLYTAINKMDEEQKKESVSR